MLKFHCSKEGARLVRLIIIGAGGHGRVVADVAREAGMTPCAFVDCDPPAETVDGLPVFVSFEEAVTQCAPDGATPAFISAIGDNHNRAKEYERALAAGLEPAQVIHPTATISDSATIGPGVFVGPQAVVNTAARIGKNAIINTAAVVEHDCTVGAHAFVAPGAVLCGASSVGDYSFVSAGAVIIPLVSVGSNALVAAGAVVTNNYPNNVRLFGIPAKAR